MIRLPVLPLAFALALSLGTLHPAAASVEVSDLIKAVRPNGPEFFGMYLLNKKVGYISTDVSINSEKDRVMASNEFFFKANVGSKVSERSQKEIRTYQARPQGKLLSFRIEQKGDGGDQILEGTSNPSGMSVVRKRPGQPNENLSLPTSEETVEDADQSRVALYRHQSVQGRVIDGQDLGSYRVSTTLGKINQLFLGGVKVKVAQTITVSEKEKVAISTFVDSAGKVVQVDFGGTLKAVAESESVAKRLDQVEVFGLTRIVLPSTPPVNIRRIPAQWTLVVSGLPESLQKFGYRQKFSSIDASRTKIVLTAKAPSVTKSLPVIDPEGGANLKSSIIVESDNSEIRLLAKKIVGSETDAYAAARSVVGWVAGHMTKDYGASADRATDVLRQMKGDCTEHSLLSVSLLRAAGIPAKRVDGLIYVMNDDGVPALYWHEWVAAFVGQWVQMDPTFNQMVADVTHLAVGEESNAEITPLIGQLKVLSAK